MRSTKDTHVAACAHAILAGADDLDTRVVSLVTRSIRDFGVRKLAALGITVLRPDAFMLSLYDQNPTAIAPSFAKLRATLRSTPSPEQLLERLAADGQAQTASALLSAWQRGTGQL